MTNKSLFCSIVISLFLLFISCSEDEPLQANNYIDPKLFGEWYLIDTLTPNIPSPEYSFSGFQINHDNQMIPLGIETKTGTIAYEDYPTIDSIIYAYNGKMMLQRFWWGGRTETFNYIVDHDKLILKRYAITYIYHNTNLSTQLFDPVISDLSAKIDSVSVRNLKVFRFPSAYISKKDPSSIYLYANISLSSSPGWAIISVEINNFNGIGEYVIPFGKGELAILDGDQVHSFRSDSSLTNNISIDQFDDVNNICSGRFSFDVGFEIKDGTFTVPIYK